MKVIIVALAFAALVAAEPRRRVRDLYISEPYRSSSSYLPYRSSLLNRDFDSAEIYSDSYYPSSSYASALYPKSYDFYSKSYDLYPKSYDLYPKSYDLYPKSFDSVYPTQYPVSQGFYPSRYYQSTPFEGFSKYYPGRFYQPYPLVAKAPYFGDYYTPEVVEPITYIAAPAAPLVAEKVVKEVIVEKEPELTYTRKPSYSLVQKEIVKPLQETVVEKFVKPATETFVEKVIQPATETIVKKYVQEQPAKYTEYTIVNGEKVPVSEYTIVNGEKVPSKVSEYSILNGDKMPSKVSEYKIVNGEKMPINTEENKPVMESSQ